MHVKLNQFVYFICADKIFTFPTSWKYINFVDDLKTKQSMEHLYKYWYEDVDASEDELKKCEPSGFLTW